MYRQRSAEEIGIIREFLEEARSKEPAWSNPYYYLEVLSKRLAGDVAFEFMIDERSVL